MAHNVHSRQPNDGGDEPELRDDDGNLIECFWCSDVIRTESDGTEDYDGDWACLKEDCQNRHYNY